MQSSIAVPTSTIAPPRAESPTRLGGGVLGSATPWYCYGVVFAATCIVVGILWDISWHSTIGRDTFWTPAHMVIYLGGTLGGCIGGWLVLQATFFGNAEQRAASVGLWGFRGPIGAWVSIWGSFAMLVSAPFDNWWHDAYGLDVKILSPPHSVLAAGMYFLVFGGLLLLTSVQNRAASAGTVTAAKVPSGSWLFVYAGGVLIAMGAIMITEQSLPNHQHSGSYYRASSIVYPFYFAMLARASKLRFPATIAATVYMLLCGGMTWVLPLFKATPMLAPIYNPVTHLVPEAFPHLLIAPALAIDLLFLALGRGRGWRRDVLLAVCIASAFLGIFLAVQWNFSKFLLSPAAENWFFAGMSYWSFAVHVGPWQRQFWETGVDPLTLASLGKTWLVALASTAVGLALGNWMSKVKR